MKWDSCITSEWVNCVTCWWNSSVCSADDYFTPALNLLGVVGEINGFKCMDNPLLLLLPASWDGWIDGWIMFQGMR